MAWTGKSGVGIGRWTAMVGLLGSALLVGAGSAQNANLPAVQTVAEPATPGGPATFRRLSEAQYKRAIGDVFGTAIIVPGRFEPSLREHGMLAIGEGKVAVSPSGIEQYELRGREIAAQLMSESRRKAVLSCGPASSQAFERGCAAATLSRYGRLLWRRPLTDAELASTVALAGAASDKAQSFYKGIEVGLARLLGSPNFIFRMERSEPDPDRPGLLRLDDYALASRVSFLLWDAPPDAELLDAVASGALRAPGGLARQVDRMIAAPRFQAGVRAFFSDMFAYDQFAGLSKDQAIYPKFTSQLAKDVQEQSLRTIIDLLVTNGGDYRDLFTTRKTFLNRNLGSLYKVALDEEGVDGWIPYSFAPSDPRQGILMLGAFLISIPAMRGAVRRRFAARRSASSSCVRRCRCRPLSSTLGS